MSAIHPGNPANDAASKPVKSTSAFKPNYSTYQTMRFGQYTPHMVFDVVPKDRMNIRVGHDLDTFSLKAPVMTPIRMYKDYFFVPHRTILPNVSDLIITNPKTGDDVDALECNTAFDMQKLTQYMSTILSTTRLVFGQNPSSSSGSTAGTNDADRLTSWLGVALYTYQHLAKFVSDGCLLNYLGVSFSKYFRANVVGNRGHVLTFDRWFDLVIAALRTKINAFSCTLTDGYNPETQSFNSRSYLVELNPDSASLGTGIISLRELLELLEDGMVINEIAIGTQDIDGFYWVDGIIPSTTSLTLTDFATFANGVFETDIYSNFAPNALPNYVSDPNSSNYAKPRNYGRCVAYQIALAHFKTDDTVDYVYSANLWRQNQLALAVTYATATNNLAVPAFDYNGIQVPYDAMSGHMMSVVLERLNNQLSSSYPRLGTSSGQRVFYMFSPNPSVSILRYLCQSLWYLSNTFNYQRSLRYRDYFCGSKTQPLAVGDVTVTTEGSSFSIVDSIRKTQIARFLNQVNRIHRKLKPYYQGIFDEEPMTDAHDPIYFGTTTDIIGAEERTNNGEAQMTQPQTITSQLRNNTSRFAIDANIAEFGYIIGITSFDVTRPYTDNTDRNTFANDRFEMFNPYMQHIGDQAVYGEEIDPLQLTPFGYQLRYMEYKQKVDRAVGGFRDYLPGYAFLGNDQNLRSVLDADYHIRPDFIRARPHELDAFFIALTNYSPAGYFHFIIRTDIECDARRPMLPAPSLL